MEYFPLGDLGQHIKDWPLAKRAAKDITTQILEALVIMHENHYTHRDIKPSVGTASPIRHACEFA